MFEEIELESLPVQKNQSGNKHNYSSQHKKNIKSYDFFTQHDVKNHKKTNTNKNKNIKNVDNNLMEIINNELATTEIAIASNVINKVDNSEQINHILTGNQLNIGLIFTGNRGYKSWHRSQDNGSSGLCPEFPQVTEIASFKTSLVAVEYIKPINMDDWLRKYLSKNTLKPRFLDLFISSAVFKHHPKMSLEYLLGNKLDETFKEYQNLKQTMADIMKEIKINRETKNNLIKELNNIIPKKEKLKFDPTIRKYTGKMLELKHKYNDKLKQEKDILNDIISLWSDIETVRHKTKVIKTPFKLNVKENELNDEDLDILWQETFNIEFSDLLDELEYDYVTKYLEYKEEKQTQQNKKENHLRKPQLVIDENNLKLETENIVNSFFKKDKIKIKLIKDESIVTHEKDAEQTDVQIRIYVDDIYVCETENHSLVMTEKTIDESFSIQILSSNSNLILTLRINDELSFVKFNIPDIKSNANFIEVSFDFNNSIPPSSKYVGSGNNIKDIASSNKVRLKSCYLFKEVMNTQCLVNLKLNWNDKIQENAEKSIKPHIETEMKIKRIMNRMENTNLEELISIMESIYDKKIDDQDTIDSLANVLSNDNLKPLENNVFNESAIDLVRIKLLYLRNKGEMNEVDNKSVPIYSNQITTEQLDFLQKSNTNELSVENLTSEKYSNMDPIELQRYIGVKYIESLNKNIERTIHDNLFKRSSQDVVVDLQELSWRKFFSRQLNMSKLKIFSNNMTRYRDDVGKENEIHVTVSKAYNLPERMSPIINDDEGNNADENIAGYKMRSLRPFVRVHYKNNVLQTSTAIGCHPTWNQTLTFTTTPENLSSIEINIFDEEKSNIADHYPDSDSYQSRTMHYRCLNKWIGCIHIPTQSLRHFGKLSGTFKMKLPPIMFGYETLSNGKGSSQSLLPEVSRMLKKETSFLTLRITSKHHSRNPNNRLLLPTSGDDYVIKHLNTFLLEYINNFPSRIINLTAIDCSGKNRCVMQFLQAIPLPSNEYFPRNFKIGSTKSSNPSKASSSFSDDRSPDKDVEKGIADPEDSVYSIYEGRNFKDDVEKIMFSCMRYVSLIPTYEVKEYYSVVLTGVELLKILCGTSFDHTILLASYFIYLGIKSYVAVGTGFPQGPSGFVLTKYDLRRQKTVFFDDQSISKKSFLSRNDRFIWYVYDASSGERYELRDITCPLKTADYIFDDENIWVNIQSTLDCESISFDLNKSADWQMVFNKNIYVSKQPPINDVGIYTSPPNIEQLRESLENKIKMKVQKWRPHMKTIWNRYCSALLKEMLPQLEYWLFYPNETKPGLSQKLKQLMFTYKMHGFPLHLPYTKTKLLLSTLKSTVVHANEDPNVEFALAVEIYPYPNNVLSVWVFLASMSRI